MVWRELRIIYFEHEIESNEASQFTHKRSTTPRPTPLG